MNQHRPVVVVTRAWPNAQPTDPEPPTPWPDHALVVVHETTRPAGGRLRFGMARLIGGTAPEPSWTFYGRGVRVSHARRHFGAGLPAPIFLEDFLEEVVRRSCQRHPRAALVAWSVPHFISSSAWSVDAKGDVYRFRLRTWTNPEDGKVRPDFYRSRVRIAPSSSGVAQVGFDRALNPDPQDFVRSSGGRLVFWRGRFLSLSTLAYALTGEDDITHPRALELYGIESRSGRGSEGLAAELDATCDLYRRLLADLTPWQSNPAPDRIGSPAALAKIVARSAVSRTPRERPGVSTRGNAAAAAAHTGGRDEVLLRHEALPVVLADGTAFYPLLSGLLGTGRWLAAERIQERRLTPGRGLARLRRRLAHLADPDVLLSDPGVWQELCGVALVKPDDDVLALRVLPAHEHDPTAAVTITAPIAKGSEPVWVAFPDLIASATLTGRVPEILEARTWRPVGIAPRARARHLPGGVIYDPRLPTLSRGNRFADLGLALAEAELRLRLKDDLDSVRIRGSLKIARNAAAYGIAAEVNPSKAKRPAWDPRGKVGEVREEPGNFADPAVAACVTAGGHLLLALLERLYRDAGGTIVRFDTDAATIVATAEGGDIVLSGGSGSTVRALSFTEVIAILNRFAPLVEETGLSIPAYRLEPLEGGGFRPIPTPPPGDLWSVFKLESENFTDGDRWTPGLEVMAVAEKRYAAFRRLRRGRVRVSKSMGHSIAALDNFRTEGRADWDSIDRAWETGILAVERGELDRDGLGLAARDLGHKDFIRRMDEPVLQPFPLSDLRQWRGVGCLRFSRSNPDGLRPFETVLVPALMGQGLKWVPDRLVVIPGEQDPGGGLLGHDTKGRTYTLITMANMGKGSPSRSEHRLLAVQNVGSWLAEYFARPEPSFVTPTGESCGPETRGRLEPQLIKVVGRIVGGGLAIRWRQDEPSRGWSLHRKQEAIESSPRPCSARGCDVPLTGRRRWCDRHRKRSGIDRSRWVATGTLRPCGCGCDKTLRSEQRADAHYLNPAHKERARRKRIRRAAA